MKCPSCGAEVGAEDVFCGECGTQLPRKRRKLGVPVVIGVVVAVLVLGMVCVGALAVTFWPRPTPTPSEVAQVSPTPPPIPTSVPVPTTPSWPLALTDDFNDPESGFWEGGDENRRHFYEGGGYGIEVTRDEWSSWSWGDDVFSDFVMEVDVIPEGETGEGGMIFRREGSFQFYHFTITPDGQYRLRKKVTETDWEEIIDWTESPHVRRGTAMNRLRVVCVGSAISFYVNGQYLDTAEDTTFTEGEIGMVAGTMADESYALFNFDNLRVFAPTAGPVALFEDDFSDPGSGWEVDDFEIGSMGYRDGSYLVISSAQDLTVSGLANRSFEDLIIEVDATQVSGGPEDNNDYGVICRAQPNGDGYYLLISGDGYYSIIKSENGVFESLVDWTESGVIRRGNATNRIRAVCDGSDLALFVNGELLADASDSTFSEGDIGLTATTYEEEPTEIHFDNLLVFAPPLQ